MLAGMFDVKRKIILSRKLKCLYRMQIQNMILSRIEEVCSVVNGDIAESLLINTPVTSKNIGCSEIKSHGPQWITETSCTSKSVLAR